jgi:hypothetical protein
VKYCRWTLADDDLAGVAMDCERISRGYICRRRWVRRLTSKLAVEVKISLPRSFFRGLLEGKIVAGTVPTAAELDTLTDMVSSLLGTWHMRLFSSNLTPSSTTTLAALLAAEASFTGYAAASLTGWTTPSIDGTSAAITTSTTGQFTPTSAGGTGNLYGYFLTNAGGTKLYGAERFASAPLTEAQNVTLEVDCTYSLITRF